MNSLGFNEDYKVLTDEQGIMLSKDDALALLAKLKAHFSHSPLEMEAIGRRMLAQSHPTMVDQFNMDWFKYTPEVVTNG